MSPTISPRQALGHLVDARGHHFGDRKMHEIIKYEIKPVVAQLLFDFMSRLTKFYVDNEDISDPAYGQGAPIIIDIKDDDIIKLKNKLNSLIS